MCRSEDGERMCREKIRSVYVSEHSVLVCGEKIRPVWVCLFQNTVKDFAERSKGILQESMKWAPNAVRSHLIHYVLTTENSSSGMHQHSGLALATESVLNYAGYNKNAAPLGVSWMQVFTLYHQICLDEPRGCAGGGATVQKHQQ